MAILDFSNFEEKKRLKAPQSFSLTQKYMIKHQNSLCQSLTLVIMGFLIFKTKDFLNKTEMSGFLDRKIMNLNWTGDWLGYWLIQQVAL